MNADPIKKAPMIDTVQKLEIVKVSARTRPALQAPAAAPSPTIRELPPPMNALRAAVLSLVPPSEEALNLLTLPRGAGFTVWPWAETGS
jgi:hypothetical protein